METLFWTVAFCLGWRIVTDEGQILHFLKKPFIGIYDKIDNLKIVAKEFTLNKHQRQYLFILKLKYAFGQPFITCITCMASIWGISVFIALNGIGKDLIIPMILNSFAAAFIQTFIWDFYGRYIK